MHMGRVSNRVYKGNRYEGATRDSRYYTGIIGGHGGCTSIALAYIAQRSQAASSNPAAHHAIRRGKGPKYVKDKIN